ncbi:unnamed protein product [Polarella glacialis]|uniref:Uncharacterized protein n=1 Tax=Polarella glacialis TaxID=89957 RepID=A0A813KAI6_POLGL|nr:unnamed protein product [Polarella glacialis]
MGRPGNSEGVRMVVPHQVWMLQRLEATLQAGKAENNNNEVLQSFLAQFQGGPLLLHLSTLLAGCRLRLEGGRLLPSAGWLLHKAWSRMLPLVVFVLCMISFRSRRLLVRNT